MFWCYFIVPASIFTVDKMVSLARQKREISVIDSELLPSGESRDALNPISRLGSAFLVNVGSTVYVFIYLQM